MRGDSRVGGFAFGDPARGSKLGHHTPYVVGVDVQTGLAAESVLDVLPVELRFGDYRVIGNTMNEFSAHSQSFLANVRFPSVMIHKLVKFRMS
jgi:hypothetical protein